MIAKGMGALGGVKGNSHGLIFRSAGVCSCVQVYVKLVVLAIEVAPDENFTESQVVVLLIVANSGVSTNLSHLRLYTSEGQHAASRPRVRAAREAREAAGEGADGKDVGRNLAGSCRGVGA